MSGCLSKTAKEIKSRNQDDTTQAFREYVLQFSFPFFCSIFLVSKIHDGDITYGGVPLNPTLQQTLQLYGRLQKSGVGDKNPQKRAGKIWVSFTSPAGHDTSRLVWI